MHLRVLLFLFSLLASTFAFSQRAQTPSSTFFTIGKETVTLDEFRHVYEKNNPGDPELYSEKNIREYLDLYIKFKLKVTEAYEQGIDTVASLVNEFKRLRSDLSEPYLNDREVTDALVREAYERMKQELNASHILIRAARDATPADTLAAWNKIKGIRDQIVGGASFEELAKKHSDDTYSGAEGGKLGWFSAFTMVYSFESAAYGLKKVGDLSPIVRSDFGYHIIKLDDKRPSRGDVQIRHILLVTNDKNAPGKVEAAGHKADSLYQRLLEGESFSELASRHSDHLATRSTGGELPRFNSFANYPEEFKDAAFGLKSPGDFTRPFQSQYGWHMLQLIEKKELGTFSQMEETLKRKIARDSRADKSKEAALASIKARYKHKVDEKTIRKVAALADSSLVQGTWKAENAQKLHKKPVLQIEKKKYTAKDLAEYIEAAQQAGKFKDPAFAFNNYKNDFINAQFINHYDGQLEQLHPEFDRLAREYKEGLMLFEITDRNVWTRGMMDSVGQHTYWEQHKGKYTWPQRADAVIYEVKDARYADSVIRLSKSGLNPEEITARLELASLAPGTQPAAQASLRNAAAMSSPAPSPKTPTKGVTKYYEGKYEAGAQPLLSRVAWKPGYYKLSDNGTDYVVHIREILPAGPKAFDEVRGLVISEYQDQLEKTWLDDLRKKYAVAVNEQAVKSLIRK